MGKGSSRYGRNKPSRSYKRRFLLVCEGEVTEPEYFNQLGMLYRDSVIEIKCLKKRHSDPKSVIDRANQESPDVSKGDELWIILDVDEWTNEQFNELEKWSNLKRSHHVAVSNPCFEIWLVLHEQDPQNCNKKVCQDYFEKYIAR